MTCTRRALALAAGIGLLPALALGTGTAAASTAEPTAAGAPSTGVSGGPPQTAASAPPQASPVPPAPIVLSDERTVTTWAHPLEEVRIRARPLAHARTLARTHLATEDGFPEVYLLLSSITDARGSAWVRM